MDQEQRFDPLGSVVAILDKVIAWLTGQPVED